MVCDCSTSEEERASDIQACGEDCLNRMLMIEWLASDHMVATHHLCLKGGFLQIDCDMRVASDDRHSTMKSSANCEFFARSRSCK